ncbi:MAG TPA: DUF58 domain-containing protein, partial [Pseudoxanthomonas sp.]
MRPAWPLIACLALWGLSGLAVLFAGVPQPVWLGTGATVILLAALDALWLWRRPSPVVAREMPEAWPLGIARDVTLRMEAAERQRVDVFDLHPGHWTMQGLPQRLRLRRGEATAFHYRLCPTERGDA